jgi:glyoxylase-like metal-dependent hydrolase (beta-lactamase superfamily II)
LGVAPVAVSHVVLTHAHPDHCCGVAVEQAGRLVARFPNARHLIGAADWAAVRTDPPAESPLAARLAAIAGLGRLESVTGETLIAPGITLIPTPGETPGHLAVRVESHGARCDIVGDLFHHPCEVAHPDWSPPGRDAAGNRATRARLLAEAAASQATIVFTHHPFPPWGRIMPSGQGFRWVTG